MLNLYIGSLKVHDSVNATDLWLQTPIVGLDYPDSRITSYNKPGEDGAVISAEFYGSRAVTLHGYIKGATSLLYEQNRIAFIAACAQKKDAYGYPVPTRITFTTLAGNTYYFDAYLRKPVMDYSQINSGKYMLTMITADPNLYANNGTVTTIVRAIGGGAIVPFVVPVILAPSSGGSGTAINNGNGTSYPILKLTGPLTNPYISNNTVGKFMQLNYTITAGNYVAIDMLNKTIMLNGTSSILSTKTSDSNWWALIAGSNNIQLSTGTTADTGNVTISYNDAYLGV